jgi:hypothetical protein
MGIRSVFAMAALAAAPVLAAVPEPVGLAPNLRASLDEEPSFVLSGSGVNIYECRAGGANGEYVWAYVAPDATYYEGSRSAARSTSPNLVESLGDRSSVSGVLRSAQPAGRNLPWTLMRARPLGDSGLFANVTSIQRVNTNGGLAPAGGCNGDTVGNESRVAYSADYYFYRRRGTS